MFDALLRRRLADPLDRIAGWLDRPAITPDRLTVAGLALGLASAVAAGAQWWGWALAAWLLSRLLDGLDGPLARRRAGHRGAAGPSYAGGFLDITADFVSYGAGVVGVAVGVADGQGRTWLPFLLVLLAYYINGTAFLAFSSAAERSGQQIDDGRSFSFLGGLAEGAETIAVHAVWLLFPAFAPELAWGWAVVVGLSAGQRIVVGHRLLSSPPSS